MGKIWVWNQYIRNVEEDELTALRPLLPNPARDYVTAALGRDVGQGLSLLQLKKECLVHLLWNR